MSGGHWDYSGYKIEEMLGEIGRDPEARARFPRLAVMFVCMSQAIPPIEHDLAWDFSQDADIHDDAAFEKSAIDALRRTVNGSYEIPLLELELTRLQGWLDSLKEDVGIVKEGK